MRGFLYFKSIFWIFEVFHYNISSSKKLLFLNSECSIFFLLRGIITKLGQSWTLHSLTAQERLLVILYRRKIYSSLEEEWCVVVVSNAYCTNLWGTFLCQNTPSVSLFGTKHLQNKKSVYAPSLLLCTYQKYTATRVTNKLEVESVHKSQIFTTFSNYRKYLWLVNCRP